MDAESERFVAEFGGADFHHHASLLPGIRKGRIVPESLSDGSGKKASAYLDVCEFRLQQLGRKRPTKHVESLKSDLAALCERLRDDPTEPCDFWVFSEPPHFSYSVVIGRRSKDVVGCVKVVDDRLINGSVRKGLWGDSGAGGLGC